MERSFMRLLGGTVALVMGGIALRRFMKGRRAKKRKQSFHFQWLVNRIRSGKSEKSVPFIVTSDHVTDESVEFTYSIMFMRTGVVCASGSGSVGSPIYVNLSSTGFGFYSLEVSVCPSEQRLVEKALGLIGEELKPACKPRVAHVRNWNSSGTVDETRLFPQKELTRPDCFYVSVEGCVYDVADFMNVHPGGKRVFLFERGQDCTERYMQVHSHVDHRAILGCAYKGKLSS